MKTSILFLYAIVVLVLCCQNFIEPFVQENDQHQFVFLYTYHSSPITHLDMLTPSTYNVGILKHHLKKEFINIYKLNNCNIFPNSKFSFITKNADFFIDSGDPNILDRNKYKFIQYFPKHLAKIHDSRFHVWNGFDISMLLLRDGYVINKSKLPKPLISFDENHHFVISNNINGKHYQISRNTDILILFDTYLSELEIELGDLILLKDQYYHFMNGTYKVTKVFSNYVMLKRHINLYETEYRCVDDNFELNNDEKIRESCEHEYDVHGQKREKMLQWDARCQRNMECPLYDTDDKYSFGCHNGFCSFPDHLEPISYTKYKQKNINECYKE